MRLKILLIGLLAALMQPLGMPSADAQIPRFALTKADLVVVHKGRRVLELKRHGRTIRSFTVALGRNPEGAKRKEGDGRTPEGVYILDWRNPNSSFYRSIHVSYPQPRDLAHAIRWNVSAGGEIMIHGLPNARTAAAVGHPRRDWTDGCIAVTNEEMDEIWARVEDGTPIIIYP